MTIAGPQGKTWETLPPKQRVGMFSEVVRDCLDKYEKERPDWLAETVLKLVHHGIFSLRAYLDKPDEKEVSWPSPAVELQYPVAWAWGEVGKPTRSGDRVVGREGWGRWLSGEVSAKELPDIETASKTAADVALHHRELAALQYLTHGVVEWREAAMAAEGRPAYVLPENLANDLDEAGLTGTERSEAVDELSRPFTLGTTDDATRLIFEGKTKAGEDYACVMLVLVYPVVVDYDERRAYYPVEVGLNFLNPDTDPSAWSDEDRRGLWEGLLAELEGGLAADLGEEETGETPETGTLPTPRVGPARTLLEGPTRLDDQSAELIRHAGGLRLPRKFGSWPRWADLEQAEIKRLVDEYGDDAFRRTSEREPLVRRRYVRGEEALELYRDAEEALLATAGHRGFRRVYRDKDGMSREYLVRRLQAGGGYVEVRLSWYGTAALLVDEGREHEEAALKKLRDELDGSLFEDLDGKTREDLDARLRWLQAVKDGRRVMELILGTFGRDGINPVCIPAGELRTLLECEADERGHARVWGCLEALRRMDFYFQSAGLGRGLSRKAMGSFLSDVVYEGRGGGKHTDGDFYLTVSDAFVGSLKVFSTTSHKLKNPRKVLTYDWSANLDKDDKDALRYVRRASTLMPYYDQAKGFTETQKRLSRFVVENLTENRDAAAVGRKDKQVLWRAANATEHRVYGADFCDLLPEGRDYHAALGHFSKNAETGRKLAGTPTYATKTGGGRTAGLLAVMGYDLPPGRASTRRGRVLREAVADMRAVVEEAMGGVVVARLGKRWLTVEEALELPAKDLASKPRWLLFVASDWRDRLVRDLEKYHADRRDRGEVEYLVKVTTDRSEYQKARAELAGERRAEGEDLDVEPLRLRLHKARKTRGLNQADVAKAFGVSQPAIAQWENGTDPDDDGKVRGKPIPAALVPLVAKWVKTGEGPTAKELEATRERSDKAREAAHRRPKRVQPKG